jgi:hypothetical protein
MAFCSVVFLIVALLAVFDEIEDSIFDSEPLAILALVDKAVFLSLAASALGGALVAFVALALFADAVADFVWGLATLGVGAALTVFFAGVFVAAFLAAEGVFGSAALVVVADFDRGLLVAPNSDASTDALLVKALDAAGVDAAGFLAARFTAFAEFVLPIEVLLVFVVFVVNL